MTFKKDLALLCAEHVADAMVKQDHDQYASIIEALASSLSMSIAVTSQGNKTLMNELAEGTSSYIFETINTFAGLGEAVGKVVNDREANT